MPKIDLEGLAPLASSIEPGPAPPRPDPQLEIMLQAMESPRGLLIPCPNRKSADALRFKFYRSRQAQQKRQNYSLDTLVFSIDPDNSLRIVRANPLEVKEL